MTNELHNRFINATNNPTGVDTNVIYISPTAHPSPTSSVNSGIVSVDTTVGGIVIVPDNPNRVSVTIQNQGVEPILLKFDGIPTTEDYDIILAQSSGTRIGDGGTFGSEKWRGVINGIVETGSSDISIFEEVAS